MSDDLVKRAAALVEKEKAWDEWEYPSQPAPPVMVQGEVATLVSDMAAEITRLRAELATARRDGMEEAADLCDELNDYMGGICAIAIRTMIDEEDKKAAIRAAAGEGK